MSGIRQSLARLRRRLRKPGGSRLVGLMAVRNEDWVLGLSLRAAFSYCDAMVIIDHASSDGTRGIIDEVCAEFPDRGLDVRRNDDVEWNEMDVRQELLERGRALGGTHFAIVDADELPTGNLLHRLRRWALSAKPGEFNSLPMVAPYLEVDVRRHDGVWGADNRIPWCFGDAPALSYMVAGGHQLHRRVPRAARNGGALVGAREGGLFHLQFIDAHRLAAKAVWYKMIETLRYPGARTPAQLNEIYDWALRADGATQLDAIPASWWQPWRERGWLDHLKRDARPWQLAEVERLMAAHVPATFSGLELHGITAKPAAVPDDVAH